MTATFHETLHLAIEHSGLSLENIQRRLMDRKITVSLASLSYWRRGRTRPERRTSLAAVAALEDILALPDGSLRRLLGKAPHPLGQEWAMRSSSFEERLEWKLATAELRAETNNALAAVSVEADLHLGPDRQQVRMVNRRLLMSLADGIDRYVTRYAAEPGEELPVLGEVIGATTGEQLRDLDRQVNSAELRFDRPLPAGETLHLQWTWEFPLGVGTSNVSRTVLSAGARTMGYRLFFHPDAIPPRCHRTWRPSLAVPEERVAELRIGARGSTHYLLTDAGAGWHGAVWDWV
ncbi:hypothetical protein N8J89_11555 [Crossiella sp. CA-258035]|uniref:hypothetical protein n=1 Tax=Crossiella sp. CA-258035 TaxID=2981138 RepID=UPI0024BD4C3E|nr:hypothetical protein [Crossiella sp. CA-258035]WHT21668.1 hypothetical protein N8J89_11555 [Crossiella sp. CA-258035]